MGWNMGAGDSDSYKILARHYDKGYAANQFLADIPFYIELAKQSGGPVLEMACGTGRILLRVAREGVAIHGVDNSPAMLGILREHVARELQEVRERVTEHEGDMRNFRLEQKFPLVIIPFRPMQHMYTVGDQVDALKTAAFHLAEEGRVAFDVFYPKFEAISENIGKEIQELEWTEDAERGRIVRRWFRKKSYDKIQQTFAGEFIFRTYEGDKLVLEESDPLKMCYYTYQQLRALFLLTGLEVAEEYGSFARAPLDNDSEQMIFVLRKANPRARVTEARGH
ncbi:MAG TPA: class I SAM-dependent methyltransferase [Candidatus Acidoferrum sp.]|nr:class I SAM-dependent methyltransferase [Candidatus Acidoferrum sp.]